MKIDNKIIKNLYKQIDNLNLKNFNGIYDNQITYRYALINFYKNITK